MRKNIAKKLVAVFLATGIGLAGFSGTADAVVRPVEGATKYSSDPVTRDYQKQGLIPLDRANGKGDPTAKVGSGAARVTSNKGQSNILGFLGNLLNLKKPSTVKKAKVRTVPGVLQSYEALSETEKLSLANISDKDATHKLVFKKGNVTYTAYVKASTVVVNRKGEAMKLSEFAAGNKISVKGSVSGAKIYSVQKVRNITIPALKLERSNDTNTHPVY